MVALLDPGIVSFRSHFLKVVGSHLGDALNTFLYQLRPIEPRSFSKLIIKIIKVFQTLIFIYILSSLASLLYMTFEIRKMYINDFQVMAVAIVTQKVQNRTRIHTINPSSTETTRISTHARHGSLQHNLKFCSTKSTTWTPNWTPMWTPMWIPMWTPIWTLLWTPIT